MRIAAMLAVPVCSLSQFYAGLEQAIAGKGNRSASGGGGSTISLLATTTTTTAVLEKLQRMRQEMNLLNSPEGLSISK